MVRGALLFLSLVAAWPVLAQPHPDLSSGPMLAYAEMTETAVWVQTTRPARVTVRYWPKGKPADSQERTVATTDEGDHIALVKLTALPMGTKFDYRLLIDGQEVKRDYPLEFQTQPHWRWAQNPAVPPEFKVALGSCSYTNDPPFDRPGTPYGGDHEIFAALHRERPDLMVWLGDNLYYREMDWLTESAMRLRWRKDRQLPVLQPLLASTHHYAIWDDHDYGPNDSDRSFRLKGEALRVFSDYFPSLQRGTPETRGCFFRFEWGDCEFFMLDNRYWRAPNRYPDGPDKVMFGPEQIQWLKDSLVSSNAAFKFIVAGGQMIQPRVFFEGFGNFKEEQKDLFDFIAQAKIPGVVFLSGDRHAGELLKVEWPGAPYPWYEVTTSPLTAGSGRNEREADNPARVPGTWVTRTRHYGVVHVRGPRDDRRLVVTHHDKDGKELWRHEIKLSELRAPR
jgi:alkaline phosphatase D